MSPIVTMILAIMAIKMDAGSPIKLLKSTIIVASRTPIPAGAPGVMKPASQDIAYAEKMNWNGMLIHEPVEIPEINQMIPLTTEKNKM